MKLPLLLLLSIAVLVLHTCCQVSCVGRYQHQSEYPPGTPQQTSGNCLRTKVAPALEQSADRIPDCVGKFEPVAKLRSSSVPLLDAIAPVPRLNPFIWRKSSGRVHNHSNQNGGNQNVQPNVIRHRIHKGEKTRLLRLWHFEQNTYAQ